MLERSVIPISQKLKRLALIAGSVLLTTGCAMTTPSPVDAFKRQTPDYSFDKEAGTLTYKRVLIDRRGESAWFHIRRQPRVDDSNRPDTTNRIDEAIDQLTREGCGKMVDIRPYAYTELSGAYVMMETGECGVFRRDL